MGYKDVYNLNFRDGHFVFNAETMKNIEDIINEIKPDYVITHTIDDFHQDHIAVAKCIRAINRYSNFSLITFASQDIKQAFNYNLDIDITEFMDKKMEILELFRSQIHKPWFDKKIIMAKNAGINTFKFSEKFYIDYMKI